MKVHIWLLFFYRSISYFDALKYNHHYEMSHNLPAGGRAIFINSDENFYDEFHSAKKNVRPDHPGGQ
jgi:hypothetical protein